MAEPNCSKARGCSASACSASGNSCTFAWPPHCTLGPPEEESMRVLKTLPLLAVLFAATPALAQEGSPPRPFGLGLQLGAPTAIVGKYYIGNRMALAMGLGVV